MTGSLLLVGSAHAHLVALRAWARAGTPRFRIDWVTESEHHVYSGSVSSWIAGEASADSTAIPLAPLAARVRATLHSGGATAIDAASRTVVLRSGRTLTADVLSVGVGSRAAGEDRPGVAARALRVKPAARVLEWPLADAGPWVVVGGGLAALEVSLCLGGAHRDVVLVRASAGPTSRFEALADRALHERRVREVRGEAAAVTAEGVALADGRTVPAAHVVWATGAAAHPLLASSGLALGPDGAIEVDDALRSTSHPHVFAGGDCADVRGRPVPRSGVSSVRQGEVLAENLRSALEGGAFRPSRPRARQLALVDVGDGTALLRWGSLAGRGRLLRRWKARLDEGFLASLRDLGP